MGEFIVNRYILHVRIDRLDLPRCRLAAKRSKFKSVPALVRGLINGHFRWLGWEKLRRISKTKIRCINGHEFCKGNTIITRNSRGWMIKRCRICYNKWQRDYYWKKKGMVA